MRDLERRSFVTLLVLAANLTASSALAAARFTRGPYLQDVSSRQAAVLFELDAPHEATVDVFRGIGDDAGAIGKSAKSATRETTHELVVSGLEPATSYRYTVKTDDGAVESGTFATAPEDDRAVTFILYGDNRTNAAAHTMIARAIAATPADFLVNTGDMVYDGSETNDWTVFFGIEREVLRNRCLFPAIGNHEIAMPTSDGALKYARAFRVPSPMGAAERWYTFRWGLVRFFVLDAQDEFASDERDWLEGALKNADGEAGLVYRFAVMHHGPYSSGLHGPNQAAVVARVPELLRAHRVDVLFAGHDHIYERGEGGGLRYLVSGGGGAPLYMANHHESTTLKFEPVNHFVEVALSKTNAWMTAVRADGSFIERCGFAPNSPGWSCGATIPPAPPATLLPAPSPSAAAPTPSPAPATRRSCGCEMLREGPGWIGLGLAAGLLALTALRRGGKK